jgi:hypothetical protein
MNDGKSLASVRGDVREQQPARELRRRPSRAPRLGLAATSQLEAERQSAGGDPVEGAKGKLCQCVEVADAAGVGRDGGGGGDIACTRGERRELL